jgi:integrase/recombinase XerC
MLSSQHLPEPHSVSEPASGSITEEMRDYDDHLRTVQGLSSGTRSGYLRVVHRLLSRQFVDAPFDFANLKPSDVRRFLNDELQGHQTPSYASYMVTGLRSYLRYRTVCGNAVGALEAVIASPAHWTQTSLPRALTAREVEQLLSSCAQTRPGAKRSYAIIRCALDLGLRAGEIARLMIGDIDWQAGTVTLRGTKSLRQDLLPLPFETGQALAGYLQTERPTSASSAVFVRNRVPHDLPMTSTAVQKVITRAFRRSGLPYSGSHRLRHTFACRLVEQGSSLKEVADLLRHRSLTTTQIYAKLDTPSLALVALPWPGSTS